MATTGSHDIFSATSFRLHAEKSSIPRNNPARTQDDCIDIVPDGRCLDAVLGFSASISLSIIRLSTIARPRAPTAAKIIQKPSEASLPNSLSASTKPIRTNGSENSVCSTLTNSRTSLAPISNPLGKPRINSPNHLWIMEGDSRPSSNGKRTVIRRYWNRGIPSHSRTSFIEVKIPAYIKSAEKLPKEPPLPIFMFQISIRVCDEQPLKSPRSIEAPDGISDC